ncbi:PH-like domain-containing protein [Actinoalloteichus caeruleus]|uniref:PH domain-containing protein n=1 Tax=Actinoalloteichus caeruleus DSM 43889 TaxID=1120930 RepID=A0ABT1JI39_ACTCY|nr:hypothetical protein [Actinoalloteichus caeruleus]MCP2331436.1 hypothetical protein [Actinoalloteichus caeruleus DSM 43889]
MIRLLLTLLVLAVFALCVYGMWRGWQRRATRQEALLGDFPAPPAGALTDPALLPELTGVYVGATSGGNWQDRIVVGDLGHRSVATLRLLPAGLLVDRVAASPIWIAAADLVDARLDSKLAGKVMPGDGLLVVSWQHGEYVLDLAFRADDRADDETWVERIRAVAEESTTTRTTP